MQLSELTKIINDAATQKRAKSDDFSKYRHEIDNLAKNLNVLLIHYTTADATKVKTASKKEGLTNRWPLFFPAEKKIQILDLAQSSQIIEAIRGACFSLAMRLAEQYAAKDCVSAVLHPNTHHRALVKNAIETSTASPAVKLNDDSSEQKSDDIQTTLISTKTTSATLRELLEELKSAKETEKSKKPGSINPTGSFQQLINTVTALVEIEAAINTKLSSATHGSTSRGAYFAS